MTITQPEPINWLTLQEAAASTAFQPHREGLWGRQSVHYPSRLTRNGNISTQDLRDSQELQSHPGNQNLTLIRNFSSAVSMAKLFPLLKPTFFLLHHIGDSKPSTHSPQVTWLAVPSWNQPEIFVLWSVSLRNKAGSKEAFSALSLTMAKKMQAR